MLNQCYQYRVMVSFIMALLVAPLAHANDTLAQARSMVKSGQYQQAYALLEPLEVQQAGDPEFDYIFGIAALETGHATRAVFALERVLALQPDNAEARAEIAKAHLRLGEAESAKSEFQHVLDASPPDDVKQAINRYMSRIDKAIGNATTFNAYLEGTLGWDMNVNSATDDGTVSVPVFGGNIFTLSRNATERDDGFGSIAGGASVRFPINKHVAILGAVNGMQKMNWRFDQFDTGVMDFNLGVRLKHQAHSLTLTAQDGYFFLDSEAFRRNYGGTAQWQYDIDAKNQVSAYVQKARLAFYGDQDIRDVDRLVGGVGYAHAFAGDKSPVAYVGTYIGDEDERSSNPNAKQFANDIYGVRVGGQMTLEPKLVVYANAAYENRDYNGQSPFFLKKREDDQFEFAAGARIFPGYSWTIRPQFSYIKNNSNIVLNEFDRYVLSVSFRHDFNW